MALTPNFFSSLSVHYNFTEIQIMQVIADLFSAGMETIKTTLLWINVFMLRNPEQMRRVQEELDQVIGRHRLPTIEDLQFLPLTETTILESMRRSSIVPLATTHSPTRYASVFTIYSLLVCKYRDIGSI